MFSSTPSALFKAETFETINNIFFSEIASFPLGGGVRTDVASLVAMAVRCGQTQQYHGHFKNVLITQMFYIDPIHKGMSLFLSYTNMKEHPKISKVKAISDLRDLYGNKIQGLSSLTFMFYTFFKFQ